MDAPFPTIDSAPDPAWLRKFQRALGAWFDKNARELPWRLNPTQPPKTPTDQIDAWRILVSETMLQQTQVATVIPYYERFLATFPDVAALAAADERDVLRLWEGLGYYRRARALQAAAKRIVARHDGAFPETLDEVRALPGVGRYTAGAVLSIARDVRAPILEANTIRLFARLTACDADVSTPAGQRPLWTFAERILPANGSGRFNQALMELGALVCRPKSPECASCPVAVLCPTRAQGRQAEIPRAKPPKKFEDVVEAAAWVVDSKGRRLARLRQSGEWWTGMWDFPRMAVDWPRDREPDEAFIRAAQAAFHQRFGLRLTCDLPTWTHKHGVTRFRIVLHAMTARLDGRGTPPGFRWVDAEELAGLPLSSSARKMAERFAESDKPKRHRAKRGASHTA